MADVLPDEPDSETALLLAVRERIRVGCGYGDAECEIEYDELAPATVGNVYVVVSPAGVVPGPCHEPSGGVVDKVFSVSVSVILKMHATPRSRTRELFLWTSCSLNKRLEQIQEELDFRHPWPPVMERVNELVAWDGFQGFEERLRLVGEDKKPRAANQELFAAGQTGSAPAGLVRSLTFGGARRIRVKTAGAV